MNTLNPAIIRQQISNLLLAFPELAEDEVLRADTIEGETEAFEFLRYVERLRREATTLAGGIATTIAELEQRQQRFERREKALRALEFSTMQAADLHKVVLPEATLSISKGKERLEIPDESMVPDDFCRITKTPDKTRIFHSMKERNWKPNWGAIVQGEPSLSVRTK